MKLSSSTLCGCCFCCYCHCWLMMLLMVLSVVHVSPEMSSTTTTTKKYTKLYNNNYAYQSEMTEFLQLNRKIPNRTSRTVAKTLTTTTSPPSLLLSTTSSPLTATITSTTDNHYKQNNVNSYPIFEHEAITTIATIQTQSTTITKTSTVVATQSATAAAMKTTLAPEQIQNPVDATTAQRIDNGIKRQADIFYIFDNSIEEKEENKELEAARNIETTSTNYVADYSKVFVPPTEPFVETLTMTNTRKQVNNYRKNHNTDNKRKNNLKNTKYWNASIDLNRNLRHQQQQHNNGYSRNSNLNNSESNNDFTNITKNISSKYKQKTTNTFNLNHNNRYGTVNNSRSINIIRHQQQKQQQNHLSISIANGIRIRATKSLDAAQIATTINSLPSSGTIDYRQSSTYNFKNHNSKYNNNKNLATSTDSVSNISPKEINHYSDDFSHHLQIPTSTLMTTALRTPATYSPLHEHHHSNQLKRPALLYRHTRQAAPEDEQNDKCRMFIEGDPEKNELYSPDYPNDYPKNINCTRVITAPKGQIIRLDFRNSFNIEEKDECKFDFLEIRDGQYGFSNLIGKYCGTDFPPEITSKERYLWLHFHSDESIEYSGFTAVYEFIDRNRDAPSTDLNCTIERDGYEGYVNATDVPTEIKDTVIRNKIPLDCMWRIQVQEKWKIQVKFVDFKLAKPNDCETNFLDIFPEQTVMPLRVKNFCGSAGEGITSDSNILHVRFYAEQSAINSTFSILYTAFRERGSSSCTEDEYDCEDATCIAGNLKCNGRSNCKFLWDEEDCDVGENGQSEHMTIIITVFGLILGGMVITFLVNCVRKIMHDQKIIREVPVLSDGIYHIDSFILDAPKTAICVGLQDDFLFNCKPGYDHDYTTSGHENMMSIDMDFVDDISSNTSFEENSYITQSENRNSIDSIELHENCCTAYGGVKYQLNNELTAVTNNDEDDDDGVDVDVKHVFDNDEFIIVPHVPQKLITSHCDLHSGLMLLTHPAKELLTTPQTSDSCNSSPAASSVTANTSNSSGDSNYITANNAAIATVTNSSLSSSCYRDDMLNFQCFMQKCAH
ncbi:uncharacterized protein LOC111675712 isoform X2 [Lucilia cuprina]|uniref:uncharacterized protein LOC111675712 isoform X2 n=1 Tax=Lucilia cuprina TaxID=7375 RepID=UPI001F05F8EE|nr:uncharacterized protein LOC111675712 isoform X2 [Lucilia cuprina]